MCVIMKTLMSKKQARLYAKKLIKNIDKQARALEILDLLKNNEEFVKAKKVALYHPLDHEVDLLSLMDIYKDKKFYFPKTKKDYMDFREVNDLKLLIAGKFNLKEPNINTTVEDNIDVYLVPCLASSKNFRIGHGAGYYDRYFKSKKGYKIGIVFKELKDLNVIVDNYDIPMDIIL